MDMDRDAIIHGLNTIGVVGVIFSIVVIGVLAVHLYEDTLSAGDTRAAHALSLILVTAWAVWAMAHMIVFGF